MLTMRFRNLLAISILINAVALSAPARAFQDTTDPFAQRKAIDQVFAHLAMGSEAQAFVTAFYRGDPPQKRGQTQTVSIDVKSVLPNSNRTYEIEWIETTHDLNGGVLATDHWKGSFSIALNPPTEELLMRVNPLGIYVTDAAWTKVL